MTSSRFTRAPRRFIPPAVCKKKKKKLASCQINQPYAINFEMTFTGIGPFGFSFSTVGEIKATELAPNSWQGFGHFPFIIIGFPFVHDVEVAWRFPANDCNFKLDGKWSIVGFPGLTRGFTQLGLYTGPHWFYHDSGLQTWPAPPDLMRAIGHLP